MRSISLVVIASAWAADGRRVNSQGHSQKDSQGTTEVGPSAKRRHEHALSRLSMLILAHPEAGWQAVSRHPRMRPRSGRVRAQLDEGDFLDSLLGDAGLPPASAEAPPAPPPPPPPPPQEQWQPFDGYISGTDIGVATMTVQEAWEKALTLPGCTGFCFRGEVTIEPVDIYFKTYWNNNVGDDKWTSFKKIVEVRAERAATDTFDVSAFLEKLPEQNHEQDTFNVEDWGGGRSSPSGPPMEPRPLSGGRPRIGVGQNRGGPAVRDFRGPPRPKGQPNFVKRSPNDPPPSPYAHIPKAEREGLDAYQKELQYRTGYRMQLRELPLGGFETEEANIYEHLDKNKLMSSMAKDKLSNPAYDTNGVPLDLFQEVIYEWDADSFEWMRCASIMHNRRIVIQEHGAFIHAFSEGIPEYREGRNRPMTSREFVDAGFPTDQKLTKRIPGRWNDQLVEMFKERVGSSEADTTVLPWSDEALETRGLGWMAKI